MEPAIPTINVTVAQLTERARTLASQPGRHLLGLVGAPGSGKSTLAEMIAHAVGATVQVVEMDGFHLSNDLLDQLGRRNRKGARDTFDAVGYVDLLRRLRAESTETVYAPMFDRSLDRSIAGAIAVEESCSLVITAGNYLLLDQYPWSEIRELLDQAWFLEPDEDQRTTQLVERHQRFGRTLSEARAWASATDEPNAELVRASRNRADLVARLI